MKTKEIRRAFKNRVVIPLLTRAPSRRRVAHILHIARTGGTAIRSALPLESALHRVVTPTHTIFFRNHSIGLRHIPHGQKVVFGVRDPAERFVSGFYERKSGGRFHRKERDYEKAAFDNFDTPRALARALSSPDPEVRLAAEDAISSILHTRVKLSDWIGSPETLAERADDILYVYQQRHLAEDFAEIQDRLSLPAIPLPEAGADANRTDEAYDTSLDDLARRNLREWYAEDYRLIDACEDLFVRDGRMAPLDEPAAA